MRTCLRCRQKLPDTDFIRTGRTCRPCKKPRSNHPWAIYPAVSKARRAKA
ncbi:MAG: hypothetical protein RIR91_206 [Verrucomicrobiota bacterium]|jgi:hypothetical protein